MKDIQPILTEFVDFSKAFYGDRLVKIILFGSYARGEANEESDVDLLVVLKDEKTTKDRLFNERLYIANADLLLKYNIVVQAFPVFWETFINSTKAIYRFIKRDGRTIYE